jgi:hypothetical protein
MSVDDGARRPVEESVEVAIALPLPMDVVGSVLKAMGTMWPAATTSTSARPGHMVVRIPNRARKPKGSQKALRAALQTTDDPGNEPELMPGSAADPDVLTVSVPEPAAKVLASLALEMLADPLAVNYVEQTLTYQDKRLVVIACWSPNQTPHALRLAAEARATAAEAEAAALRAELSKATAAPASAGGA